MTFFFSILVSLALSLADYELPLIHSSFSYTEMHLLKCRDDD